MPLWVYPSGLPLARVQSEAFRQRRVRGLHFPGLPYCWRGRGETPFYVGTTRQDWLGGEGSSPSYGGDTSFTQLTTSHEAGEPQRLAVPDAAQEGNKGFIESAQHILQHMGTNLEVFCALGFDGRKIG